jgi:uncharacterized sulfatase
MFLAFRFWFLLCLLVVAGQASAARPNIVWLTSEDHGPHVGCYGDTFATTPNMDALAKRGMIYRHCWSNAPVCAPARTTLISGMYPTSTGSEHMRSMLPYPKGKQMFPQFLRAAGYYCTNNSKEDYNLEKPGKVWDESSAKAHWKKRDQDQPFFAVFNSTKSHESQIRKRPHKQIHDPAKVRVPAYHPDTPEVRQDWAQYYDCVTEADADAGQRLKELEEAGLMEETIIFYFADHGSGMPRNKRTPCNSGLQVPLVIYIPEKYRELASPDYKAGGETQRLVSFVDFAPTVLSLAGIEAPDWMQGFAFLGKHQKEPQPFVYGFRGRMDERQDIVRSVTDGRYVYVRNYMPHLPAGQHNEYMFQTPTTRVWKKLFDEGKLTPEQAAFWKPRVQEELYDLEDDPDEVKNIVDDKESEPILADMRWAINGWQNRVRDVGLLPEGEIHSFSKGKSPYDVAREEESGFEFSAYQVAALSAAQSLVMKPRPRLEIVIHAEGNNRETVATFWVMMEAMGELGTKNLSVDPEPIEVLKRGLGHNSEYVRAVAAEAIARYGKVPDQRIGLAKLLELAPCDKNDFFVSAAALQALDRLDAKLLAPHADKIRAWPTQAPKLPHQRYDIIIPRLTESLRSKLR